LLKKSWACDPPALQDGYNIIYSYHGGGVVYYMAHPSAACYHTTPEASRPFHQQQALSGYSQAAMSPRNINDELDDKANAA
jgi:hypothetical protein